MFILENNQSTLQLFSSFWPPLRSDLRLAQPTKASISTVYSLEIDISIFGVPEHSMVSYPAMLFHKADISQSFRLYRRGRIIQPGFVAESLVRYNGSKTWICKATTGHSSK